MFVARILLVLGLLAAAPRVEAAPQWIAVETKLDNLDVSALNVPLPWAKQEPAGLVVPVDSEWQKLGLRPGDVITQKDSIPVHENPWIVDGMLNLPVGWSEIVLARDGRQMVFSFQRSAAP